MVFTIPGLRDKGAELRAVRRRWVRPWKYRILGRTRQFRIGVMMMVVATACDGG